MCINIEDMADLRINTDISFRMRINVVLDGTWEIKTTVEGVVVHSVGA